MNWLTDSRMMKKIPVGQTLWVLLLCLVAAGCGEKVSDRVQLASSGRVRTLDPAYADDLASRDMVAAFYDTLLQYAYPERPYRLQPSMLQAMPEADPAFTEYRFKLREDLYFAPDRCFGGKKRKVTSADVIYSLKRLEDPATHSPVRWMVRDKFAALTIFSRLKSG